jgi:hypothetical protein
MTVPLCGVPTLLAFTNALGVATFRVRGSVISRSDPAGNFGCVDVSAGVPPVLLGTVSPSAYDQDGLDGLTANDWALLQCDVMNGVPMARSDLSGDGVLNGMDLAQWLNTYFEYRGGSYTAARCDGGATTSSPATGLQNADLRLAWNQCASSGGAQTRTFACGVNGGGETLVASFVAPANIAAATGFEAEFALSTDDGAVLPSWWRFDPGGCRQSAFVATQFTGLEGESCPDIDQAQIGTTGLLASYLEPGVPANTEVVRVVGTFGADGVPLVAGQEYTFCYLRIAHTRTVGAGACAGCAANVMVQFRRLKLTEPATPAGGCGSPAIAHSGANAARRVGRNTGSYDYTPDYSMRGWVAYFQGVPMGLGALGVGGQASALRLACTSPARGEAYIGLTLPRAQRCTLALFDVAGRQRRVLLDGATAAGARSLSWDGRDDAGASMASGWYVLRLVAEDGVVSRPLIRVD